MQIALSRFVKKERKIRFQWGMVASKEFSWCQERYNLAKDYDSEWLSRPRKNNLWGPYPLWGGQSFKLSYPSWRLCDPAAVDWITQPPPPKSCMWTRRKIWLVRGQAGIQDKFRALKHACWVPTFRLISNICWLKWVAFNRALPHPLNSLSSRNGFVGRIKFHATAA